MSTGKISGPSASPFFRNRHVLAAAALEEELTCDLAFSALAAALGDAAGQIFERHTSSEPFIRLLGALAYVDAAWLAAEGGAKALAVASSGGMGSFPSKMCLLRHTQGLLPLPWTLAAPRRLR